MTRVRPKWTGSASCRSTFRRAILAHPTLRRWHCCAASLVRCPRDQGSRPVAGKRRTPMTSGTVSDHQTGGPPPSHGVRHPQVRTAGDRTRPARFRADRRPRFDQPLARDAADALKRPLRDSHQRRAGWARRGYPDIVLQGGPGAGERAISTQVVAAGMTQRLARTAANTAEGVGEHAQPAHSLRLILRVRHRLLIENALRRAHVVNVGQRQRYWSDSGITNRRP
jgi:hypothetical protein